MALYFMLAIFFVLFDRFLKSLAVNNYLNTPIEIIKNFFSLYFTPNYYIAFSIPIMGLWLNLIILLIIVILINYYFLFASRGRNLEAFSLIFIIIGAASNLFDRFKYGYVIDYFDVKFFTIFNLADVMIVGGVLIILLTLIKKKTANE